jgi:hypothetical protein
MTIYRGLNVAKALNDIDDAREALGNLGLDRADFDLIAGLTDPSTGVSIGDFHNMAGLESDQKKELESLSTAADYTEIEFIQINDISVPLKFNIRLDGNKFVGGAIKYNYLDFSSTDGSGNFINKAADISTSRLSSWSPVGPAGAEDDYILYGGDVKIIGDKLGFTELSTTEEPIAKTFRAEVATHALKVDVRDGSNMKEQTLYMMKGIPLEWEGVFEYIQLRGFVDKVTDDQGTVPITWRVTNLQAPAGSYNSGDGSNNTASIGVGSYSNPATYTIEPPGYIRRKIEFFYNPDRVIRLDIKYANINKWTNVSLPSLRYLDISFNDFAVIPEFRSDGSVAKQGFSGGLGLAPNLEDFRFTGNNLGRGNDYLLGSDRENTGNSSQQINRLPLTLKQLRINGCFEDSTSVDLEDYENLTYLDIGSNFTRELHRPHAATKAPAVYNPKYKVFFSTESILWTNDRTQDDRMSIGTHNFETGDAVKYDYHVDSSKTMAEPIGSLVSVSGGVVTTNTTWFVRKVSSTIIQLYNSIATANAGGSNGRATMATEGGAGHGKLHSLTKFDVTTGKDWMESTTKGIQTYRHYNQPYTQLPPGCLNSRKLYYYYGDSTPIVTNSETPYYTDTASVGGTITSQMAKEKSSRDMSLPTPEATDQMRYFYSQWGPHNIVSFKDNTKIEHYKQRYGVIDSRFEDAETTIVDKFTGCTNLQSINLSNHGNTSGNFTDNLSFQNMPNLRYVNCLVWKSGGPNGHLTDNMFDGSLKLNNFQIGGQQMDQFTNDTFGTSGTTLGLTQRTGKALANANPNFRHIIIGNNRYGSGTLVQEEVGTHNFDFPTNDTFRTLYLYGNNLRGYMPNIFTPFKLLNYLHLGYQSIWMRARFGQPKQVYKIFNRHLSNSGVDGNTGYGGSNYDAMTTNDWKAIGWIANQLTTEANLATLGEGAEPFANPTGSDPQKHDAFKFRQIPIVANNPNGYLRKRYYRIMKAGTTDWDAISVSTYKDLSSYSDAWNGSGADQVKAQKALLGVKFLLDDNVTITSQIAGTGGAVNPYSQWAGIKALGLYGSFPTMNQTMTNLRYMYLYHNSFSGPCPKLDSSKLIRWYAYNNFFTGSIPDFSTCGNNLRIVKGAKNLFSTYTTGFLSGNTNAYTIDFSNNRLEASMLRPFLIDMVENYLNGGVTKTINFKGQSGPNRLREGSKFDGTTGEDSTEAKLKFLRGAGWSILLDS